MSEPFIAEIKLFAGNFAPRGFAFCEGQLLPIAQNTALFALIGTTYGGDGRSTTALPNLRGRAAMHPGRGAGLSTRRLGESGGSETHTLTAQEIPAHTHAVNAKDGNDLISPELADSGEPGTNAFAKNAATALYGDNSNPADLDTMAGAAVSSFGGGSAHNNMQPFLEVYFIIALIGLFPSRA